MRKFSKYIPLLIMILVGSAAACSLYGYEMPEFTVEASTPAREAKAAPAKIELLERPEETVISPAGSGTLEKIAAEEDAEYKDGIYYGSGVGFGGTLRVKVTVKNGEIASIGIVSHNETGSYLARAKAVIGSIIKKQTTNVDTVSGATYSSVGIIKAVRNALAGAKVKKSDNSSKKNNGKESSGKKTGETKKLEYTYPDGKYRGAAFGFSDYVNVEITIKDGRLTKVKVISHGDDESFFERARAVIKKMINTQTTEVDSVSGATKSSRGIIEAVENALEKARAENIYRNADSENKSNGRNNSGNNGDESGSSSRNTGSEDSSGDNSQNSAGVYADGVYTGSAVCYPDDDEDFDEYNMSLKVAVKGGRISDLGDISSDGGDGNLPYINRAFNLLKEKIIKKGGTDGVDAVSGATCSSVAILNACTEALHNAKSSR